jgi:hypothetical protein
MVKINKSSGNFVISFPAESGAFYKASFHTITSRGLITGQQAASREAKALRQPCKGRNPLERPAELALPNVVLNPLILG